MATLYRTRCARVKPLFKLRVAFCVLLASTPRSCPHSEVTKFASRTSSQTGKVLCLSRWPSKKLRSRFPGLGSPHTDKHPRPDSQPPADQFWAGGGRNWTAATSSFPRWTPAGRSGSEGAHCVRWPCSQEGQWCSMDKSVFLVGR